ncbi:hypothetical protein B7486_01385 [cyanobacterium TDX16]|nr:hypothetical protein B7486_01385 [cyanobacterium TDX16]
MNLLKGEDEMLNRTSLIVVIVAAVSVALMSTPAQAEDFQLLTGVNAGMSPGAARSVFASGPPAGAPGSFVDGDRLAGTAGAAAAPYVGTGSPLLTPNQYGSLSFLFRRGSIPLGPAGQQPLLNVDYLGGPLLDLDGDLGNGSRRLTPQAGQTPVEIPGTKSSIGLNLDTAGGSIGLTSFDATATNSGFPGFGPNITTTVNTLAGTQPNTTPGAAINPGVDTRQGSMSLFAPNVYQVSNLGYEIWHDSIDPTSSTASTLGTFQYLGSFRGWVIERDINGNFPTLTGLGLGSTLWPTVNSANVGGMYVQSGGAPPIATITNGPASDQFSAPNNGGLSLTDFGGDLGSYLDNVVLPLVDPLSQRIVYLESAGFGMNNSFDPIFGDTTGYDAVLIAQSAPIPEPTVAMLLLVGAAFSIRRVRRSVGRG